MNLDSYTQMKMAMFTIFGLICLVIWKLLGGAELGINGILAVLVGSLPIWFFLIFIANN